MKTEDYRNRKKVRGVRCYQITDHMGERQTLSKPYEEEVDIFIACGEDEQTLLRSCEQGEDISQVHGGEKDTVQVTCGGLCTSQVMWESSRHCLYMWG